MTEKTYEPYFVIVWTLAGIIVREIPYKEDAYNKYEDLLQLGVKEIALAKLIKKHGEG